MEGSVVSQRVACPLGLEELLLELRIAYLEVHISNRSSFMSVLYRWLNTHHEVHVKLFPDPLSRI